MLHTSLSLLLQSWVCRQGVMSASFLQNERGFEHLSEICFPVAAANSLAIDYKTSVRQQPDFFECC